MMPTWKMHQKFQYYYGRNYKHSDISNVCNTIVKILKPSTYKPKTGTFNWCRNNWAGVCNFLKEWEGR